MRTGCASRLASLSPLTHLRPPLQCGSGAPGGAGQSAQSHRTSGASCHSRKSRLSSAALKMPRRKCLRASPCCPVAQDSGGPRGPCRCPLEHPLERLDRRLKSEGWRSASREEQRPQPSRAQTRAVSRGVPAEPWATILDSSCFTGEQTSQWPFLRNPAQGTDVQMCQAAQPPCSSA